MTQIVIYFYYAVALALGVLTLFFAFKVKQAKGAGEMNEIMTSVGSGSFGAGVKTTVMGWVWALLCLGAGIGTLATIGLAVNKGKEPVSAEQVSGQPALADTQPTAPTPISPPPQVVVETEKKPAAEVLHTDNLQIGRPVASEVSQNNKATNDKQMPITINKNPAVPSSDLKTGDANAIQVCESATNFFSKNNCRFEQCAKQENVSKPECENFQKK